ncbi:MAG TPA: glycoside hydrolase family 2 protein, partial [Candidatus Binatia bacterium]|nr:glycoside hydrolase family 2 protein [Candidatus Binatia bacterium]
PGFAPGPPAVGPWRPVRVERRRGLIVERLTIVPRVADDSGVIAVDARLRPLGGRRVVGATLKVEGPSGVRRTDLELRPAPDGSVGVVGTVTLPAVERWWPHTHGEPTLHDVELLVEADGEVAVATRRVGFRSLAPGASPTHDVERDGLDLRINDRPVFARGAVWTPLDPIGLAPSYDDMRDALVAVRDAGMNMLRVPGTSTYEGPDFHDLCDELGILVWQDFMFATLDYPFTDESFLALAEREANQALEAIGGRPSTVVLCGSTELEQQVAMLGLDPTLGRSDFLARSLPALASSAGSDAIYVPSAPFGGDLPFRTDHGIADYYGVGAYRRPLSDARTADVRFAAECLAFANVPDDAVIEDLAAGAPGGEAVFGPRWKAGVPRDVGAGWDGDDVRDHYFRLLFGLDPFEIRRADQDRYLELSRTVSGEVMAEVFGEWRRTGSRCGGGLVLWLRDLVAGAGWGVVDHRGLPKVAYHHLRRALAPVAVWTTDEGLNGVDVHVANDRPTPLDARLRVALYRDLETRVEEATEPIALPSGGTFERGVEELIGRFVDPSWAYRFGPPGQDAIVATLETGSGEDPLSQAFRFPVGRPLTRESSARLGLEATARRCLDGTAVLSIASRRLAWGIRIDAPGYRLSDDAFSVEPGGRRTLELHAKTAEATLGGASIGALNLAGRLPIAVRDEVA